MSEWISVKDDLKPPRQEDEDLISIEVLLYVPAFVSRGLSAVVMGNYLYGSKKFRPANSHGWEKEVTHWQFKPEPPK